MDKRIKYRIVIDTETCPIDITLEEVTPFNMWMYDVGWAVVDRHGNVYKTCSFVNADIFLGEKTLMNSAFYADKIPLYWDEIKKGQRILTTFANIVKAFRQDIQDFNITEVYAHNMRFDYNVLNNTSRWISKSKYRYFFPYGIEICDTLKMAKSVIATMPTYQKWCAENNYITKTGKVKLTAEIIYRFISGDENFTEKHTGLEDVMIEKDILAYCFRKHKKMNKFLFKKA